MRLSYFFIGTSWHVRSDYQLNLVENQIKLLNPVKIDGVEVHELSLRRPKVRDLIAAGKKNVSESEGEVNLIANLAEVSPETIQDLDLCDYMKIQDWLKDFLSASTGRN